MTVETQANRVQYMGNGLTREFPVPFPVLRPEHLRLFLWANDRQTELTQGCAVLGAGTSAVKVVLSEPLPSGVYLTILRRLPFIQPMSISNSGPFNAETLEGSADNLAMQIQQLAEENERAIVFPEGLPGERPNYSLLVALGAEAGVARDQALAAVDSVAEAIQAAGSAAWAARDEARKAAGQAAEAAHSAAEAAHTAAEAAHTAAEAVRSEVADLAFLAGAAVDRAGAEADRAESLLAGKLDAAAYAADSSLRIKAKVCFTSHHPLNDAQITILEAYNIASVTRWARGRYEITFLNPLENADYCVAGLGSSGNGRVMYFDVSAVAAVDGQTLFSQIRKTAAGFRVAGGTMDWGGGDPFKYMDNVFAPATLIII